MAAESMTGFGRTEGRSGESSWVWEGRSVNSRNLDLRFRFPPGFDYLEKDCRDIAAREFVRGSMSFNLNVDRKSRRQTVVVNAELAQSLIEQLDDLGKQLNKAAGDAEEAKSPDIGALLSFPGIVEVLDADSDDEAEAALQGEIKTGFGDLIAAIREARLSEGKRLEDVVREHIVSLESLFATARALDLERKPNMMAELREQIAGLVFGDAAVDEARLEQEVALIIVRADVTEELNRIGAHVAAALELLELEEPLGRRLEFLVQELNREANTLCAKAGHLGLNQVGLEMKTVIDRIREQALNLQ